MRCRALLFALTLLCCADSAAAQQDAPPREPFFTDTSRAGRSEADTTVAPSDADWTPFFEHAGVSFAIIHYRRADNQNGGVVLRLVNNNDGTVRYRLRLGFLASRPGPDEWRSGRAQGVIGAGEMKTGSKDGLFWVPFEDGTGIAEVRMQEYQIVPVE